MKTAQDAREIMIQGQVNAASYLARRRRQERLESFGGYFAGIASALTQGARLLFDALAGRDH
jgi:hypothetical protein